MTDDGWRPGAPGFPERRETMSEREELLAKAAQDFIDKVDRGEARSKRSYAAFKAALAVPAASALTTPQTERRDMTDAQKMLELADELEALGCLSFEKRKVAANALRTAAFSPLSNTEKRENEHIIRQFFADGVNRNRAEHALDAILALSPTRSFDSTTAADRADYKIGGWLSAALEDPAVCDEMKADINAWFEAHQPGLVMPSAVTRPERCSMCGGTGKHRDGCINDHTVTSQHQQGE